MQLTIASVVPPTKVEEIEPEVLEEEEEGEEVEEEAVAETKEEGDTRVADGDGRLHGHGASLCISWWDLEIRERPTSTLVTM